MSKELLETVSGKVPKDIKERFAEKVERKGRNMSSAISDFVCQVVSGELTYNPGKTIIAPSSKNQG